MKLVRNDRNKDYVNDTGNNDPKPAADSSKTHFTPNDIRLLPSPAVIISTRKRRIQRSEVLTSSSVKELWKKNKKINLIRWTLKKTLTLQ